MSGKVTDAFKVQAPHTRQAAAKGGAAAPDAAAAPAARAAVGLRSGQLSQAEADEAALRQFDLASKYGPVSGLTRLQRFERAEKLGLQPPPEVKQLIQQYGEDSDYNKHLFDHPF